MASPPPPDGARAAAPDVAARRRRLRQEYGRLLEHTAANAPALRQPQNIDALLELQGRVDANLAELKKPLEAGLDSRAFHSTGELVLAQATQLKVDGKHTADDFVQKYLEKYGTVQEDGTMRVDWRQSGMDVRQFWHTAPAVNFLFGPLKLAGQDPAPRKQAVRRAEDGEAAVERPEPVAGAGHRDPQQETTRRVVRLHGDVRRKIQTARANTISFPDAFMDKESFARSAENLFHASFLVKDGLIGIRGTPQPKGIADIRVFLPNAGDGASQEPRSQAAPAPASASQQCIVRFNRELFEKWCRAGDGSASSSSASGPPAPPA
eukprot:EG_transcript_19821